MFGFKAYFWNSDVYINEKYRFVSNEILTAYLNDKHYNRLYEQDFIYNLKYFKGQLVLYLLRQKAQKRARQDLP